MKIQNKFFLILFSFSLILVTIAALLMQWSIGKGMIDYVNTKERQALEPLIESLAEAYQKTDDWSAFQNKNRKFSDLVYLKLNGSQFMQPSPDNRRPPMGFNDPRDGLDPLFTERMVERNRQAPWYSVLDSQKKLVVGHYRSQHDYNQIPITTDDDEVVGFLLVPKRDQVFDGYELAFIEQQESYLWIFALITLFLVGLVSLPLARNVLGPINLIAQGMHQLTQGTYKQKIVLRRKDEFGELIRDFNELALTLDENENARKRWIANISHELRTPVAILRGELEAMLDNVRPLSKENIESSNDEVKHLQYLIDDLHQLTSADIGGMHYRKNNEFINKWLTSEVDKYRSYLSDAGIALETAISKEQAEVFADRTRLCQLFENIINNCVKYSQATLVKISSEVDHSGNQTMLIVKVEDNGIGVETHHLENLFEYLYRVDDSRNRKTGGTGLGLSICAHIVAAHQGTISASHGKQGGLAIIITLPLIK
ncbi:ATP-binding protein [Psychromonas sp. PT13]|uniref:ATP-binding protein n=1 Tax=Psychromonas sp. PT13 TaxID=3439547 RepID=UPI003EBA170B